MSCRLLSPLRFLAFFFGLLVITGAMVPAYAQEDDIVGGVYDSTQDTTTQFKVLGVSDVTVMASGAITGSIGSSGDCPFLGAAGATRLANAIKAAKASGDAQGCPIMVGSDGEQTPLLICDDFYRTMSERDPSGYDPNFKHCAEDQTMRNKAINDAKNDEMNANIIPGRILTHEGVHSNTPGQQSTQQQDDVDKANKDKATTGLACLTKNLDRVGDYWAQRQEYKCFKDVRDVVMMEKTDTLYKQGKEIVEIIQHMNSGTAEVGGLSAIIPIPSPYSLLAGPIAIARNIVVVAEKLIKLADELADELAGCNSILPDLAKMKSWQATLDNSGLTCQGLSNLVERQLTQCIRANVSFDFGLPQFAIMTQCPINISVNAGFANGKWFSSVECQKQNPITISGTVGGKTVMSGGLTSLFSGDCYETGGTARPTNSTTSGANADGTATRIPGIDCGPTDPNNPLKKQALTGQTYLAAGTTTDGWVAGGSEVLPQVAQVDSNGDPVTDGNGKVVLVPAKSSITVTRCDFYTTGRLQRTVYVYGSGSSCNAGVNGFLDGGYEANTACYGKNYTPATAPIVPDACMYPAGCLDASGTFSQTLVGTSSCAAGIKPVYNSAASYMTSVSGGFDGGEKTAHPCTDFSGQIVATTQCCDPQMQDCTKKDANTPLCVCDQGDASNTIFRDAAGNLDPAGSCVDGGKVTCCSPRLNGADWCNANMGAGSICADEVVKKCDDPNATGTRIGVDGRQTTVTAANMVTAKPTPYIYLFVRPDMVSPSGQQCCNTEWCNICPQHYANAYGLSLARSTTVPFPVKAIGDYTDSKYDKGNDALIGQGWPFQSQTDSLGVTHFKVGALPAMLTYYENKSGEGDAYVVPYPTVPGHNPLSSSPYLPLQMSPNMQSKPDSDTLAACNRISQWQSYVGDPDLFNAVGSGNDFGFIFDNTFGKSDYTWSMAAPIPSVQETPLAYMNRIRTAIVDDKGNPLAPIPLCSAAVQICTAPTATGSTSASSITSPVSSPVTQAPAVVVTPAVTTSGSGGKLQTPTDTNINGAPTEVPSAGTGQASPSLY